MQVVSERGLFPSSCQKSHGPFRKIKHRAQAEDAVLENQSCLLLKTVDEYLLIVDDAELLINDQVSWEFVTRMPVLFIK